MKKILKNLAAAAMLGLVFCTGVTSHASNGNVVLVLDPGRFHDRWCLPQQQQSSGTQKRS